MGADGACVDIQHSGCFDARESLNVTEANTHLLHLCQCLDGLLDVANQDWIDSRRCWMVVLQQSDWSECSPSALFADSEESSEHKM